jgi:HEAT repeat protein
VEILLRLAEDEKQAGDLRRSCAEAVGNLGRKDQAVVERLLRLAEDEKQAGDLRRSCAHAIGKLGEKHKALAILLELYLAKPDKYDFFACRIYNSLWDLTEI